MAANGVGGGNQPGRDRIWFCDGDGDCGSESVNQSELATADISAELSGAMRRLQAKLEGERGHEWIEMRVAAFDDLGVCYEQDAGGRRVLWVGRDFAQILGSQQPDQTVVNQAIGDLVYHGCLCADGNRQLAERRKKEFLCYTSEHEFNL